MLYLQKFFILLSLLVISACAAPQENVKKRFFWPPLTDDPKIEYVRYIQTDYDVKKKNISFLEESIFGRSIPKLIFGRPFDVYSNGSERIYISEAAGNIVHVIDLAAGKLSTLKDAEGRTYSFRQPLGVNGDSSGRVYVVDSLAARVAVFDENAQLIDEWTGKHFQRPVNIAVDTVRGKAYVVEPEKHVVTILRLSDGSYIGEIGGRGIGEGEFNFPLAVDFDAGGNIYVLDSINARVQKFSKEGVFLLSFGERGTALGSFQLAKDIAVSPEDHIYITDSMAHKIVVFDTQGRHLMTFGGKFPAEAKVAPGGLYLPMGVDVDRNNQIWVVDSLNRLVHLFQFLTEKYLEENPILPGQIADPFSAQ